MEISNLHLEEDHPTAPRLILLAQKNLEHGIDHLQKAFDEGDQETAKATIQKMKEQINVIDTFWSDMGSTPCTVRGPSADALVKTVFNLAELLEMILLNLDIVDLLQVPRVSKQFKEAVYSSKKIQEKLQLLPTAHVQTPLEGLPGLQYKRDRCPLDEDSHWPVAGKDDIPFTMMRLIFFYGWSLKLGDRPRSMLICQPPIHKMAVAIVCCDPDIINFDRLIDAEFDGFINNPTGLTMGDLIDEIERVRYNHHDCDGVEETEIDSYRYDRPVYPVMSFRGILNLRKDDPTVVDAGKVKPGDDDWEDKKKRLKKFRAAKSKAYLNNEPVPSFTDFEAAKGTGVDEEETDTEEEKEGLVGRP